MTQPPELDRPDAGPEDQFEVPDSFGELDYMTDETPGALLWAGILFVLVVVAALLLMINSLINSGGKAGESQSVEVFDVTIGAGDAPLEALSTDAPASLQSQEQQSVPIQAEDPKQLMVQQPAGSLANAATVDTAAAQQIQQQITQGAAARARSIKELERDIREARMTGSGLGGIFNVPDDVKSVVYVIDCSGSMAGPPLKSVKGELLSALKKMKANVKFFILFYSDGAYPMPITGGGNRLVEATPGNLKSAEQFVQVTNRGGGTLPFPAMKAAIDLDPELIFLLSDGQFHPDESQQIIEYNTAIRGGKKINCVGVSEQVFETLKVIAESSRDAKGNVGIYYRARQGNSIP
ncbi:MAG: hypothetical protein KDA80_07590 [Planctomycetaceae bacterium]|nr:hypothetical protein [Planctomycetaceae bacterium]